MCPETCGTCDVCEDSYFRFRVLYNGRRISRSCEWVAAKSTNLRCAAEGVPESCRYTCGECAGDEDEEENIFE